MTEATVVMFFLTLRVFLLGGILIVLPRVTRKGLMFGYYVGEAWADGDEGRRLVRGWDLGCVAAMTTALIVGYGIAAVGRPLAGNLTGTAVLLLAAAALYLRLYLRTRAVAPAAARRQGERATAPLVGGEPRAEGFAKLTLATCLLVGLATAVYAIVRYDVMPDQVPALSGAIVGDGESSEKSIVSFMFLPTLSLLWCPFFALYGLLMSHAKLSVREGEGGRSLEAQEAFRAANSRLFSGAALMFCALLTVLSVQLVRYAFGETPSLGVTVWVLMGALLLYLGGSLFWIIKEYGQGGARVEGSTVGRPLAGGLADNAHWVLGMFYVDRQDPSTMVEKRFGIGYTLNYGHRNAIVIVVTFSLLLLALVTLGLVGVLM